MAHLSRAEKSIGKLGPFIIGAVMIALLVGDSDSQKFNFIIVEFGLVIIVGLPVILILTVRRRKAYYRGHVKIEELLTLSSTEFEQRVTILFQDMGHTAKHVGGSGDGGVDVKVKSNAGERWLVQCKQYSPGNKVTAPEVRDLAGAVLHARAHRGAMVTTSTFTQPAIGWAKSTGNIDLYNGQKLARIMANVEKRRQQGKI